MGAVHTGVLYGCGLRRVMSSDDSLRFSCPGAARLQEYLAFNLATAVLARPSPACIAALRSCPRRCGGGSNGTRATSRRWCSRRWRGRRQRRSWRWGVTVERHINRNGNK